MTRPQELASARPNVEGSPHLQAPGVLSAHCPDGLTAAVVHAYKCLTEKLLLCLPTIED